VRIAVTEPADAPAMLSMAMPLLLDRFRKYITQYVKNQAGINFIATHKVALSITAVARGVTRSTS